MDNKNELLKITRLEVTIEVLADEIVKLKTSLVGSEGEIERLIAEEARLSSKITVARDEIIKDFGRFIGEDGVRRVRKLLCEDEIPF